MVGSEAIVGISLPMPRGLGGARTGVGLPQRLAAWWSRTWRRILLTGPADGEQVVVHAIVGDVFLQPMSWVA